MQTLLFSHVKKKEPTKGKLTKGKGTYKGLLCLL